MPVVETTLPDIAQAVTRPVIFDVIKQIQKITKIDEATKIFYPGDAQRMQQPGSNISDSNRDALMQSNRILFIETEEDYDQDTLSSTAINYLEHLPVFNDPKLNVVICPIYVATTVTINFKYRTQSKAEALRWRDDIRVRVSKLRDINLHDLTYHYLLPMPFEELLLRIWELRETTAGYGDQFEEYVISNASSRLTVVGDLTNKQSRLAISETQARVVGQFGFDGVPERPERDDSNGTWTISFSYKFTYDRPAACNMRYPIIVHNQLLPSYYTDYVNDVNDPEKKEKSFPYSFRALNYFESTTQFKQYLNPNPIITIPDFDQFSPTTVIPGSATAFYVLCTFDESLPNVLVDLKELGDMRIDDDIMEFILESEYPFITKSYRSILHLDMYHGGFLISDGFIQCDDQGVVRLDGTPNLRLEHRLRLSLITDTSMLTKEALERLRRYPKALAKILIAMNEAIRDHPRLALAIQRNYVTESDLHEFFRFLQGIPYDGRKIPERARQAPAMVIYPGQRALEESYVPGYVKSTVDPLKTIRTPYLQHYLAGKPIQANIQFGAIIATKRA